MLIEEQYIRIPTGPFFTFIEEPNTTDPAIISHLSLGFSFDLLVKNKSVG